MSSSLLVIAGEDTGATEAMQSARGVITAATKPFFFCVLAGAVSLSLVVSIAAGQASSSLGGQFQTAVSLYESNQFAQAHEVLEGLVRQLPDNSQVNELMAFVCDAQHHQAEAESEFKKAAELAPQDYGANHNLGEFYIREGKIAAAVPYLQRAQGIRSSYNNGYDLALAEIRTGQYAKAKEEIQKLLGARNTAELHSLLASADEKSGGYVRAANEYQIAAHMDPSEENILSWGSDLLAHRALQPAAEVFQRGVQLYPRSTNLQIGLGMALYSSRQYQQAFQALCRAIDLNPSDLHPYLVLGNAYDISPLPSQAVTVHFARLAQLEPRNPKALYYYALSLWEARSAAVRARVSQEVETLLKSAVRLDPAFGEAHLQLGILYAEEGHYAREIAEYRAATRLDPRRADAHYRLAQALLRAGNRAAAQKELETFNRLHQQQAAEWEKQRKSIIAFAYQTDSQTSPRR
jgi:predicted Zn-dependent protease